MLWLTYIDITRIVSSTLVFCLRTSCASGGEGRHLGEPLESQFLPVPLSIFWLRGGSEGLDIKSVADECPQT